MNAKVRYGAFCAIIILVGNVLSWDIAKFQKYESNGDLSLIVPLISFFLSATIHWSGYSFAREMYRQSGIVD